MSWSCGDREDVGMGWAGLGGGPPPGPAPAGTWQIRTGPALPEDLRCGSRRAWAGRELLGGVCRGRGGFAGKTEQRGVQTCGVGSGRGALRGLGGRPPFAAWLAAKRRRCGRAQRVGGDGILVSQLSGSGPSPAGRGQLHPGEAGLAGGAHHCSHPPWPAVTGCRTSRACSLHIIIAGSW